MSARKKLEEDSKAHADRARQAGWKLDCDLWWRRPKREDDLNIRDKAMGFMGREDVYTRSALQALQYDLWMNTRGR